MITGSILVAVQFIIGGAAAGLVIVMSIACFFYRRARASAGHPAGDESTFDENRFTKLPSKTLGPLSTARRKSMQPEFGVNEVFGDFEERRMSDNPMHESALNDGSCQTASATRSEAGPSSRSSLDFKVNDRVKQQHKTQAVDRPGAYL